MTHPGTGIACPTTAAGERLSSWLQALNTADFETLRSVIARSFCDSALESCSAEDRARRQLNVLFALTHGLELVSVETSTQHEVTALAQAHVTEDWYRVHMEVTPDPPHPVTEHAVLPHGPAPLSHCADRVDAGEVLPQFEAYVDGLAAADLFSGAVLVGRHGEALLRRSFGLASKSFGVPNRIDTRFNLGSMNKMFTAVAITQLVQRGRLSFEDLVGTHLPEYPNQAVATTVTVHHLLTHTSGLGSFWNDKFEAAKTRLRTVEDFLQLFVDDALGFEPGDRFEYSNSGFIVLGAIVERVSGQSYDDYVGEHVFGPAGMVATGALEMDLDVPNRAIGYTRRDHAPGLTLPVRRNNLFLHSVKGSPAGGGYSTVEDLLRFDVALRGHRLLDAEHTQMLLAGKVAMDDDAARYAYGFVDERIGSHRVVGHRGGAPGVNGHLDMYLDEGWCVAVLANYDPPSANRVAQKMRALLLQVL